VKPVKQKDALRSADARAERLWELERKTRAASAQRTLYSGVLAGKLGLHQTDLECLFIITLGSNVTPGQLALATGLTSGAVTGVVDRIEAAGYIRRRRDPDDRRRLFLEPVSGRIEEIRAINRRAFAPWIAELDRYSESELLVLLDFAERNYQAAVNATIALRGDADTAAGQENDGVSTGKQAPDG
jgi:DNA-binding MarR family transcriptional regulator